MYKKGLFVFALLFAPAAHAVAANDSFPSTTIILWGRTTIGQVVSSEFETGTYDFIFGREWLENFEGGVRLNRQLSPILYGRFHIGFGVNASTVHQTGFISKELVQRKFVAALLDASVLYSRPGLFIDKDSLQVEMGYFPFKYDPQAVNLGEYLFRSGAYPGVLVNSFENAGNDKAKIGGIHLGYCAPMCGTLKLDALLNAELEMFPLHDLSLTGIATYTPHRIFSIGAGVQFFRLIVLDDRKTTPGAHQTITPKTVAIAYIDTTADDTTIYTFRGTKLMARAMFDLKGALETVTGPLSFFGKEDLKIYGEAAMLGVKNYPGWYADRWDRVPAMFGINWPTNQFLSYALIPGAMGYLLEQKKSKKKLRAVEFGAGGVCLCAASWLMDHLLHTNSKLDLLAIEGEYYGSKFPNSQEFMWKLGAPVPYIEYQPTGLSYLQWNDSLGKTNDDWKWSVYISKKIGTRCRLSAQAACDHTPRSLYTPGPPSFVKYTELVPRSEKDWYWMLRATYFF